ncbi:MAG: HIT family protein [Burkholderiales bacterium]|jgi:diadenosine tetraphosphate (Ap4A) HIT family hydrolase
MNCELCTTPGGTFLWEDPRCRVVQADEPGYPGFCRVIWKSHVREMTDLSLADRLHCMNVVFAVERAMRDALSPAKINLASLGNFVAHVHWHVIPRFTDDPHFPQPVWATRQRDNRTAPLNLGALAEKICAELMRL